jgi:hypothetical protein
VWLEGLCQVHFDIAHIFRVHILLKETLVIYFKYRVAQKKKYTLMQQFGGFDSVWMPMVVTSNIYTESKI